MKLILPTFLISLAICSCQSYQYLSIDSETVKRDSSHQFFVENDTLLVQYNFNGFNGPVKLSVHNKTDLPIYVDWKKSAMIVQGKAYSYYSPDQQLTGTTNSNTIFWSNGSANESGTLTAQIKSQDGVDFIPPHSIKERTSLYLLTGFVSTIGDQEMKREFVNGDKSLPRMKTSRFSESSSPFRLRSYLTFYIADSENNPRAIEHEFFVASILQGPVLPHQLLGFENRPDIFIRGRCLDSVRV